MDLTELLKRKLRTDPGLAFKFDKKTGRFYHPDRLLLYFAPHTPLADMLLWVDFFIKLAADRKISIGVLGVTGFDNGLCVIEANNAAAMAGLVTIGVSGGGPHPPPPPPVIKDPLDCYRPGTLLIDGRLTFIVVSDSQYQTTLSKQLRTVSNVQGAIGG